MINNELFELITKGDIQKSLYSACKILLINDIPIETFEYTLIYTCSYIGSFINIYNAKKYIDIISDVKDIIEDDNIVIKKILLVITKMCILCEIYNKQPVVKAGNTSLPVLKKKISDVFNINSKLSSGGILKFDGVLPPHDSETYNVAIAIISGIIQLIKTSDDVSIDNGDKLQRISDKLRNSFDYICKKKYLFETKFYSTDNDAIWFLWGIISILYDEEYIKNAYILFSYNWKKTYKQYRIGILWSVAILIIYSHKRNISKFWDHNETAILNKIDDLAMTLFNEVKTDLSSNFIDNISDNKNKKGLEEASVQEFDGLDYISSYVPYVASRYAHNIDNKNLSSNNKSYYENENYDINSKKSINVKKNKKNNSI
jgi:hypothetical protein